MVRRTATRVRLTIATARAVYCDGFFSNTMVRIETTDLLHSLTEQVGDRRTGLKRGDERGRIDLDGRCRADWGLQPRFWDERLWVQDEALRSGSNSAMEVSVSLTATSLTPTPKAQN